VFASATLGTRLDLNYLVARLWNCEYRPKKNAALVFASRTLGATISVYASGRITSVGSGSIDTCKAAMVHVGKQIRCIGMDHPTTVVIQANKTVMLVPGMSLDANQHIYHAHAKAAVRLSEFAITNVTGSANFGHKLFLERFANDYVDDCTFESEISSSANFIMTDPVVANFRIFASGKILVPRVRSYDELCLGVRHLFQLLELYKIA
jgi:TATA-box binding protein (TBP) (component of TFIID and TFIIIB)